MAYKLARARAGLPQSFSNFDEQRIIAELVATLHPVARVCVDIAASDGVEQSTTHALYRAGWTGVAVEGDPRKFRSLARLYSRNSGIGLTRTYVTPNNVGALLDAHQIPREFGFLNMDIDGYDYWVLRTLLETFRPTVMCVEINEKIPPPLKFTVNFDPAYQYRGDHFYGQSLSQLCALAEETDYSLVELHYNNAFLVPAERFMGRALTAEEAYLEGYAGRADRLEKFPWNRDMEPLQTLAPQEAIEFLERYFPRAAGEYELSVAAR